MIEPLQITDEEKAVLIPRAKLTVDQWALQKRFLSPKTTNLSGPWSHEYTPYLVEPMRAFSDLGTREIWIQKCVQSAGTEGLLNCLGWIVDEDPGPTLMVMPTEQDTIRRVKSRVRPLFESTPSLRDHLPRRSLDAINSGTETELDTMLLYLAWAGSASAMADNPIRYALADEIGKWLLKTQKEADSVSLLRDRLTTYKTNSKLFAPSTPVVEGDLVDRGFGEGDQREDWSKCPHCGCRFIIKWEHVWLAKDTVGGLLSAKDYKTGGEECASYFCPYCEKRWSEADRWKAILAGIYAPRDCRVEGDKIKGKVFSNPIRSYRTPCFLQHPVFMTAADLAAQWADAEVAWKKGDKGPRQNIINSRFAECWKEPGAQAESDAIRLRVSDEFEARNVPEDVRLVVGGADYHVDNDGNERIDYVLVGYGVSERNYDLIVGSVPSFDHLENEVFRTPLPWSDGDTDKDELVVSLLAIDSGFESGPVYAFCDKWKGRAIPTKGASHAQRSPVKQSQIKPDSKRRKSRRIVKPGTLYVIDTKYFKDIVYRQITSDINGPGSTKFYTECPAWYTNELCNEQRVKVVKGGQVSWQWQPVREHAQVHGLDIKVLATVAAYITGAQYIQPDPKNQAAKQPPGRKKGRGFLEDIRTIR